MRYFLSGLIFFVVACKAQPAKEQAPIDTVRLFNPFPLNEEADAGMFKNAIGAFDTSWYVVRSQNGEVKFKKLSEVEGYIAKNSETIKQQKFYILIDSNTKFEKTVSIIDVLKKNRIDNYRVINYQQYFTPPQETEVKMSTVVTTPVKEDDSTVFSITLLPNAIEVKVRGRATRLKNVKELDEFIIKNKSSIDPNKITITGDRDMPYEKFKPVIELFKKHEFYRFSMITK